MTLGQLTVRIGADMSSLTKAFREAEGRTVALGRQMQSVGKIMSTYVTAPLVALGAVSVRAWGVQAAAIASVENGLRNVGGAVGFTSQQLQDMASGLQANSLFGDEAILQGVTANLLTFGGITGEVFERAQQAALDLSARLGQDLQSSAIQLGKALADPVRGITALSRVGVVFTAEQKALAAQMVATGRTAEAQAMILAEVERYYGGAAEAAARAGTGPIKQFTNNLGDLTEQFGQLILVGINPVVNALNDLVTWMQGLSTPVKAVIVVVAGLVAGIGPLLFGLGTLLVILPKIRAALLALNKSTIILTLKIIAITAVIAALAAAAYLIYKNWSGIKRFFVDLWQGVAAATSAAMGLVRAKVEVGYLGLIRSMSSLGAKLLEPARRTAEALGADAVVAQIEAVQARIENIVSERAVSNANGRAAQMSRALNAAGSRIGETFSAAGAAIGREMTAAWEQASSAAASATAALGDTGDAGLDAAGGLAAAADVASGLGGTMATLTVEARRTAAELVRVGNLRGLIRLPERAAFTRGTDERTRDRLTPTFGGLQTPGAIDNSEYINGLLELGRQAQVTFDAVRDSVNGISYAIGDAVGELIAWRNPLVSLKEAALAFGQSVGQVMRGVVADITAAIARALILRGLLSLTGGGGFLGGVLTTLAGGAKAGAAAAPVASLQQTIRIDTGSEMRMSHGYVLASVRAALVDEVRSGRGDGTL